MFSPIPQPRAKFLNPDGSVTDWWYRFFSSIFSVPVPESTITVTTSPFTYTAQVAGMVLITGGTISQINLVRSTTVTTGLTTGQFILGKGDSLVVTYSVTPTMTFYPS